MGNGPYPSREGLQIARSDLKEEHISDQLRGVLPAFVDAATPTGATSQTSGLPAESVRVPGMDCIGDA